MKTDTITGAKILNRDEILLIVNISSSTFNRMMNRDGNPDDLPAQRARNGQWWAYEQELLDWKIADDARQRAKTKITHKHSCAPRRTAHVSHREGGVIVVGAAGRY